MIKAFRQIILLKHLDKPLKRLGKMLEEMIKAFRQIILLKHLDKPLKRLGKMLER